MPIPSDREPLEQGGSLLGYRVGQHEQRIEEIDRWRRERDIKNERQAVIIETMGETIETMANTIDGLRKVLVGFAFSIAGSAVVFALSILVALGRL